MHSFRACLAGIVAISSSLLPLEATTTATVSSSPFTQDANGTGNQIEIPIDTSDPATFYRIQVSLQ